MSVQFGKETLFTGARTHAHTESYAFMYICTSRIAHIRASDESQRSDVMTCTKRRICERQRQSSREKEKARRSGRTTAREREKDAYCTGESWYYTHKKKKKKRDYASHSKRTSEREKEIRKYLVVVLIITLKIERLYTYILA